MFNKDQLNQLYRYALSLTRQDEMAYDLVQSGLERYLKKPNGTIDTPIAYLKTIIRNLYFDHQRHNSIVPMVSLDDDTVSHIEPADEDSMEDLLISQQQIQQLISMLSDEENELLYLWAVEEHTVEEIAAIYQKPKGTLLSKLHRLKKRIRKQLETLSIDIGDVHIGK